MADQGNNATNGGDNDNTPIIQTFNVVPQKVISVDKPTGYYGDREKTKIFIY